MKDIGLRQVADGQAAARYLGVPVAYYPKFDPTAFVREHEAWLCHATPGGDRWLITAVAGSELYRPDDMAGSAILGSAMLRAAGILNHQSGADPFGPPAASWIPQGDLAVSIVGADHIVYAALVNDRTVVTAVPVNAAPPARFAWQLPAAA